MNIALVMQFYLDALLPRDPSWTTWPGVRLQAPTFTAEVSVWEPSAQPLFPNEIDESLAGTSMAIVPVGLHDGGLKKTVADTVLDRIQVILRWEENVPPGDMPNIDLDLAQDRGVDAANVLVEHLRSAARAAWMPRVRRAWRPEDGRFYLLNPWTATFLDADTETGLPVFGGFNAHLSSGAVRNPATGSVPIPDLEASLRRGSEPQLHDALLVDAETAVQSLALREAILTMASACEVAAHAYIGAKAGTGTQAYERTLKRTSATFAGKYYEQAPLNFSSRSLRSEDPSAFSQIEDMYKERNSLIHSGCPTARLMGLAPRERQRTVYGFLGAAGRAADWITSL